MQRAILFIIIAVGLMLSFAIWKQEQIKPATIKEILNAASAFKTEIEITGTSIGAIQLTTVTTTWKSARGTHTVTTTRLQGESEEDFATRHQAEVAAMQQVFPPL